MNNKVRERVVEILAAHDIMEQTANESILRENISCTQYINEIIAQAYPNNAAPDAGVRVQSSTKNPDGRMMHIIDAREKRIEQRDAKIAKWQKTIDQIQCVEKMVDELDVDLKVAIIALYYPKRSMNAALDVINMAGGDKISISTLRRRKDIAIERLVNRAARQPIFIE